MNSEPGCGFHEGGASCADRQGGAVGGLVAFGMQSKALPRPGGRDAG